MRFVGKGKYVIIFVLL